MARIRTIKPDYWTDEKIGYLKRDIRLLFIGLWNLADDKGVLKANPAFIKGQIFPYDEDLRVGTIKEWLDALENARMLIPFTFNGESYFIIRTFLSHQNINRPTPSKIPDNHIKKALSFDSSTTHGEISEDSPLEIERKGKEIEGKGEEDDPLIRDEVFENSILNFFGFNEIANHDKARIVNEFCFSLKNCGRLDLFKSQFEAYSELKNDFGGFKHSFKKFLGDQGSRFENGAWNEENWIFRLNEEKEKSSAKKEKENYGQQQTVRGVAAAMKFSDVKMWED